MANSLTSNQSAKRPCGSPFCRRPILVMGLCPAHYQQWLKGKNLSEVRARTPVATVADYPDIASQWDSRNEDTPDQCPAKSTRKRWWKCPVASDHIWEASVYPRTQKGVGCPLCRGFRPSITNSLESLFPDVAIELHPTSNGGTTANQIVAGSNKKLWWLCSTCGHEWMARAENRTRRGQGCPLCGREKLRGRRAAKANNLAVRFPKVAKEWHPTRNGDVGPESVAGGSSEKFWWLCNVCGHEWSATVGSRTGQGVGCPPCGVSRRIKTRSRNIPWQQRLARHAVAAEYDADANGDTPEEVTLYSQRKVQWKCHRGHAWMAVVSKRTSSPNPRGCWECRSIAVQRPDLAAKWHPSRNGARTPSNTTLGCNDIIWLICDDKHEYSTRPPDAVKGTYSGCAYCSGRALSDKNRLSLLRPDISAEWHPTRNGGLTPSDFTISNSQKAWWQCLRCGFEWDAVIGSRTGMGTGCPACAGSEASPTNNLATSFPGLAAQWHPTKNRALTPDKMLPMSGTVVWWKVGDIEWQSSPLDRTRKGRRLPASPQECIRILSGIYGMVCHYCELPISTTAQRGSTNAIEVDHKVPYSKGGSSSWDNLVLACTPCNRSKSDKVIGDRWSPVKGKRRGKPLQGDNAHGQ